MTITPDLDSAEIERVTGLIQPAAQVRYLRSIGIRAERRRDGSVLVLRVWLAANDSKGAQSRPVLKSDRKSA